MDSLARRALVSVLAVAAIAVPVAGCGGDGESGDSGKNPLDNALGYLPKDTPFVAAIETDPNGAQFRNAAGIAEKFPFASQLERQLERGLGSGDANYERDIKPLLGNEFVVGATNVRSFTDGGGDNQDFIAAIQVKDEAKLTAAIEREKPRELGEQDGAKLYQNDDSFAAVDGDVLVVANSRRQLEAGLDRRGSDDRFDQDDFDKGTEGLPENAVVRTYFDLQKLIAADPDTADARKVKWVSALRTFGLSASVESDRVDVDFTMGTDGDLSDADLPLAAGDQSPEVVDRPGQIGLGLRGLDQIVEFAESAGQAVDPAQFGSFETAKRTIERQLRIDIQRDVIDQLGGDISAGISPAGNAGGLVADVEDPDRFKDTLARVSRVLPTIAGGGGASVRKSGDIYSLTSSSGSLALGMVGDKFVLSDSPAGARAAASSPTEPVDGAEGAFAMKADAGQLLSGALSGLGGSGGLGGLLGAQVFAGPLGELTGSVESSTDGISGKVSLTFD